MRQLPIEQRRHAAALEQEVTGARIAMYQHGRLVWSRQVFVEPAQGQIDQWIATACLVVHGPPHRDLAGDAVRDRGAGAKAVEGHMRNIELVQLGDGLNEILHHGDAVCRLGQPAELGAPRHALAQDRMALRVGGDQAWRTNAAAVDGAINLRFALQRVGLGTRWPRHLVAQIEGERAPVRRLDIDGPGPIAVSTRDVPRGENFAGTDLGDPSQQCVQRGIARIAQPFVRQRRFGSRLFDVHPVGVDWCKACWHVARLPPTLQRMSAYAIK